MPDAEIKMGYVPGAIGRVVELHATYYHAHWGFGPVFEAKVASELADFTSRYDERRDGFWTASVAGHIEGSITIDGIHAAREGAHLRWFIVSDALRGKGTGNRLIEAAVDFCRRKRYGSVYLWTFQGLHAARHLYEKAGFVLAEQRRGTQWGSEVTEQRYELRIADVETFWTEFLAATDAAASTRFFEAFHFDDNETDANRLAELVLSGAKTATASLLWTFEAESRRPPRVGDLSVVTNWQGDPLCVIEATEIHVHAFEEVDEKFAAAEGEGDGSRRSWREAHWSYFARACDRIGRQPTTRMPVVGERFRVVYPGLAR